MATSDPIAEIIGDYRALRSSNTSAGTTPPACTRASETSRRSSTSSSTPSKTALGSHEQRCDPPNPAPVKAGPAQAVDWLGIGIGIASGEEFVGNVGGGGFKDFTALGDVTNIAARLTAQAAAGELLMDALTYKAVAQQHPDSERRELELKGKAGPVEAFAIRGR